MSHCPLCSTETRNVPLHVRTEHNDVHVCSFKKCGRVVYEQSAIDAAKIVAANKGIKGQQGGWLYSASGRPLYHGWHSYASALMQSRVIKTKIIGNHTRYVINWRTA
jgi:hypothetical protein